MRYLALATDYDGTIAHDGIVNETTIAALERFRNSGRKLILVTGRELPDLMKTFSRLDLFDRVVAENGALLYRPETREETTLCGPPDQAFVEELDRRGVKPVSVGRTIVATWRPHETEVLEIIRDLNLELQVIFNKGAVMILPSGVNKASGLRAALRELGISEHSTAGVGDAENDHSFMSICECAVAVANAVPQLQERADLVTVADHGAGVGEMIDLIVRDDLRELNQKLTRRTLLVGVTDEGSEVRVPPVEEVVLVAGASQSGKSTFAASFLETLTEAGYQFAVIDPEGDYQHFPNTAGVGTPDHPPAAAELTQLLQRSDQQVTVNLLGSPLADRPQLFRSLFSAIESVRARVARPHWILIDEAHHVLPADEAVAPVTEQFDRVMFVTVEPATLAPAALAAVTLVIAVGSQAETTIEHFCDCRGIARPNVARACGQGEALVWRPTASAGPLLMKTTERKSETRRHQKKYAEGELPDERSFYFRGPNGALRLRAKNLIVFLELAAGVDDETWLFHLRQGDYSQWFAEHIKDRALAEEARRVEQDEANDAAKSRESICRLVEAHYTLPATAPSAGVPAGERRSMPAEALSPEARVQG